MKIEYKTFPFEVKQAEEKEDPNVGFVSGIGSTRTIDQGDDIVEEGAFLKTIQDHGGNFPMLLDHNMRKPAGYQSVKETRNGLEVEGELRLFDQDVRQRYELSKLALKFKRPMGLSIGYDAIKVAYEQVKREDGSLRTIRRLKEVKLWEISLVVFPMNTEAMVTAWKQWAQADTLEETIEQMIAALEEKGYSNSQILSALESRAATGKNEPDAEAVHSLMQKVQSLNKLLATA